LKFGIQFVVSLDILGQQTTWDSIY